MRAGSVCVPVNIFGVYLRGSFLTLRRMTTPGGGFVRLVRVVCWWGRTEGVIFVVYRMWSGWWRYVVCEGAQPRVGGCASCRMPCRERRVLRTTCTISKTPIIGSFFWNLMSIAGWGSV